VGRAFSLLQAANFGLRLEALDVGVALGRPALGGGAALGLHSLRFDLGLGLNSKCLLETAH